jgi:hypothetical protein
MNDAFLYERALSAYTERLDAALAMSSEQLRKERGWPRLGRASESMLRLGLGRLCRGTGRALLKLGERITPCAGELISRGALAKEA